MSGFDPEAFMNAEVTDANETEYSPVPKGDHPGFIKDVAVREIERKDGTGSMRVADLTYVITDPQIAEQLGQEEPTVRQSLFLDFEGNGALAFGKNKNVQLGKVREAAGLNQPGKPFSLRMLIGTGPYMINVDHDSEGRYANVKKVVAAPQ